MLQWGRTQLSAEIRRHRSRAVAGPIASMGPHSTECGNVTPQNSIQTKALLLQWGRTQLSAEISRGIEKLLRGGELQWGRTQLSAEMLAGCKQVASADLVLQWGRTQLSAEIAIGTRPGGAGAKRFNGAALN